ncbi:MAG: hypothetical protein D6690_00510 [Nitrospirae bacterium]|nr:MAG: hypothetical protein D6690_00510 [Nitrospirota bacterium]
MVVALGLLGGPSYGLSEAAFHADVSPSSAQREFSARLIWQIGPKTIQAQLFVKRDRYRIEPRGGIKTEFGYANVVIVRLDRQEVWHVISRRRLVIVTPLTPRYRLPFSVHLPGELERTFVGEAFVADRPARLYDVLVRDHGEGERYYQWVDAERNVLLRLMSQDRAWSVQYEHVVLSDQPEYFFETPLGYRKIRIPDMQSDFEFAF